MKSPRFWFPSVLLFGSILYCCYALWYFSIAGRFPPPIFYDASDTFGDYFITLFWSSREGRYDEWRSIYPMFCFFLGKVFGSSECFEKSATAIILRDCDVYSIFYLFSAYVFGAVFSSLSIVRDLFPDDNVTSRERRVFYLFLWFLIVLLSVSGLFAVERGNFIVFAFLFLSISVYLKNGLASAVFFAMAISVKQYLLVMLIIPFLRRRFMFVGSVALFVVFLNIFSMLFFQEMHQDMLLNNMLGFSGPPAGSFFEKIWNPTSINAWLKVLEYAPQAGFALGPDEKDVAIFFGELAIWMLRGSVLIAIFALSVFKSDIDDNSRANFFVLVGALVATDSLGGYAILLLFPFVGAVLKKTNSPFFLTCLLLLFLPLEIPFGPGLSSEGVQSYLTKVELYDVSSITLGSYIRPMALIGVLVSMIFEIFNKIRPVSANNMRA